MVFLLKIQNSKINSLKIFIFLFFYRNAKKETLPKILLYLSRFLANLIFSTDLSGFEDFEKLSDFLTNCVKNWAFADFLHMFCNIHNPPQNVINL